MKGGEIVARNRATAGTPHVTRRQMLYLAGVSAFGSLLAACSAPAAPTPAPTSAPAPTAAPKPATAASPAAAPASAASPAVAASPAAAASPATAASPVAAAPTAVQVNLQAAKSEGKAVGYGVLIDSQWKALDDLSQSKLGIPVENYRGNDAQVETRLTTEKDAGQNLVDFVASESIYLDPLVPGGYLQKMPPELLNRVPDKWRDPKGYWAVFTLFPVTVIYNTQLVPASDAPKALQDLLDPKWKGKIAVSDPTLNLTFLRWFYVVQQQMGKDKAETFFKGLAAQSPTMFQSGLTTSTNINQGQFALGIGFMTHVLSVGGKNGHMDYMRQDPMPVGNGALAWASKPPHPNALLAVSDLFLSHDYLQASGDLGYPITVPGIKSAIPGADSLNYVQMPDLPKDQADAFTQYLKGIFTS